MHHVSQSLIPVCLRDQRIRPSPASNYVYWNSTTRRKGCLSSCNKRGLYHYVLIIKGDSDCKRALFRTNASSTSTTRQYTTRTSASSTTSYSTPSEASSDVDGSPYEVPSAHCATRGPVCSRSPRRVFETTPAMALCSKTSSVYQISEKKIIQQSTRRS